MINDKIWDLRFANFVVHCMRQWCNRAKKDFRCVEKPGNTRVKIDNATGGAHIVEINKPKRCGDYKSCEKCEKECVNHDWNNGYIDLLTLLRAARHDRNLVIINLFFVTRKGAQLLKYWRLKLVVAQLSKEYDASLDKVVGMKGDDPQFNDAVEYKRQKEQNYYDAVAQMNAARGELFGRTK